MPPSHVQLWIGTEVHQVPSIAAAMHAAIYLKRHAAMCAAIDFKRGATGDALLLPCHRLEAIGTKYCCCSVCGYRFAIRHCAPGAAAASHAAINSKRGTTGSIAVVAVAVHAAIGLGQALLPRAELDCAANGQLIHSSNGATSDVDCFRCAADPLEQRHLVLGWNAADSS